LPWLIPLAQASGFLLLPPGPQRDAFSNLLQIAAAFAAAVYCGIVASRWQHVARVFWTFFATAFAAYGISAIEWAYYESWLNAPVPISSVSQFLYLCYDAPLVMVLLLRRRGRSSGLSWARALDYLQILLIFFLLYYNFLFLRELPRGSHQLVLLEQYVSNTLNVVLAGAFVARSFWASSPLVRELCRRMSAYMVFYALVAAVADYAIASTHATSGSWTALAWTTPFALAASLAASYRSGLEAEPPESTFPVTKPIVWQQLSLAILPITIWILALEAGKQDKDVAYGSVFLSLICYGSRLAITQRALYETNELERKQTFALEKSLSLLHSTLESTADGILVVDLRGRVVNYNSRFQTLWRIPDELLNQRDDERLLEYVLSRVEDAGLFLERVRYLYDHKEEDSFDVVRFRGGRILERYSRPQLLGDDIVGRVWSFRDVTEREQAQHEIAGWKERYDAAVQATGLIIYDWNPASNAVRFGGAFEQILGYCAADFETPTQGWRKLIHSDDLSAYQATIGAALQSKESFDAEYRVRRHDGQYRWLREQGRILPEKDAHPPHMVGFLTDITEHRMLELQLRQAQKMEAVGRLAGGVAHDFNNLLTVIAGYSELQMRSIPKTDPAHEQAEQIRAATARAATLTRQLLAFSRQQVLLPKIVDLNAVVTDVDKMLRRIIGEDIEITTRFAPSLGAVEVDPGQIEQVLVNLVLNARDAMPKGGQLIVETANIPLEQNYSSEHFYVKAGRYVRLSITDTGIGMDAVTRARLFEPFFTTKELGRGTGLGLATVYGIVKQSGGHIEVSSEPGRGTSFKIYFPLINRPVTTPAPHPPATDSSQGTEIILLVEDENALRQMVTQVLSARGYQVIAVHSAEEAEQIVAANPRIDMLLTDVIMPKVGGPELARRIAPRYPKMKVLFMSGYTANSMRKDGEHEQSSSFLEKPFTPQTLAAKVREILDTAKS
jgi:PAS domain S-box-containing protein